LIHSIQALDCVMSKERDGLECIWTFCLKYVVFLGTLFGVDLEGTSQRGSFSCVDVEKKRSCISRVDLSCFEAPKLGKEW